MTTTIISRHTGRLLHGWANGPQGVWAVDLSTLAVSLTVPEQVGRYRLGVELLKIFKGYGKIVALRMRFLPLELEDGSDVEKVRAFAFITFMEDDGALYAVRLPREVRTNFRLSPTSQTIGIHLEYTWVLPNGWARVDSDTAADNTTQVWDLAEEGKEGEERKMLGMIMDRSCRGPNLLPAAPYPDFTSFNQPPANVNLGTIPYLNESPLLDIIAVASILNTNFVPPVTLYISPDGTRRTGRGFHMGPSIASEMKPAPPTEFDRLYYGRRQTTPPPIVDNPLQRQIPAGIRAALGLDSEKWPRAATRLDPRVEHGAKQAFRTRVWDEMHPGSEGRRHFRVDYMGPIATGVGMDGKPQPGYEEPPRPSLSQPLIFDELETFGDRRPTGRSFVNPFASLLPVEQQTDLRFRWLPEDPTRSRWSELDPDDRQPSEDRHRHVPPDYEYAPEGSGQGSLGRDREREDDRRQDRQREGYTRSYGLGRGDSYMPPDSEYPPEGSRQGGHRRPETGNLPR